MKKIILSLICFAFLASCAVENSKNSALKEDSAQELPNIVLLIGDDHGYPYFGFMGADYVQTPNMDSLAAGGILFTNGYVPDNHCRPSLATLVTGILPIDYKNKVQNLALERGVTEDQYKEFDHHAMQYFETLPRLLSRNGYQCFQGGKWWEFNFQNGGFTHGMTTGWTPDDRKPGNNWFKKYMGGDGLILGRATMEPVYSFIKENKETPFFIWYAPELPHYPFDAPDKYYNLYRDQDMTESAKRYYANCTWFDDGVGELRNYLREVGEFDNTLFIYVNDNGWEQAPDQEYWDDPMRSHNGGDKGKSSIYDMSFRTPIIFSWSGNIRNRRIEDCLVHSADIPATILDLLDIPIPTHYYGQSLLNLLQGGRQGCRKIVIGNTTTHRDEQSVMGRPVEGFWIRDQSHFFRWNVTDSIMGLYNVKNDPINDRDLLMGSQKRADKYLEIISEYKNKFMAEIKNRP